MKLLVVCQYFYPEQFKINDICFELVKNGHKVTVLTGLPNYPTGVIPKEYRWLQRRHENINGVQVIRSTLIARGKGKLRLALNYLSFALFASIKSLFLRKDFDAILVWQLSPITMALPALLLKNITGKPLYLYCQDLWPESVAGVGIGQESLVYKILLFISRYIYGKANKIAISSQLFEKYFSEVIGISNNITYLPVYAESIFDNIAETNDESVKNNLVFAGNIGAMQSVETIIQAAHQLRNHKDIVFHIVGDGSNRANCEKTAHELGLENIIFYGQRPITEMPDFYAMADAFLITLKAIKEISYTLPNKVQSYMAAGKPIIGAIDGETRLVIESARCGFCCAAEDDNSLAELIERFVADKEAHLTMGNNARKYYQENFNKETFMNNLAHFLEFTSLGF